MASRNPLRGARRRALGVLVVLLVSPLARANITVVIHGVAGPLRANVLAYLSFERYRNSARLSADTIERLENRVESEVTSALQPFGYYQPTVRLDVRQTGPGNWRVALDIQPGPPVKLAAVDIRLTGPGALDPLFTRITARVPFHRGERLDQVAYERFKGALLQTAATYGYLDARLTRHQLLVDPQAHTARIELTLTTGARYRFGTTRITQHVIRTDLARRYLRYRQGDPFDLTQVLRTQFALDDTGYFSNLEVQPGTPEPGTHTVPVNIEAGPGRRNVYSVAGGYGTDTGARGILSWQDRRMNAEGHRLSIDVEASRLVKYSLQTRYVIPIGDPATENLTFSGSVEQRQLAAVDARTMSFGPRLTRVAGRWQIVYFVDGVHATGSVGGNICPAQQFGAAGACLNPVSAISSVVNNMLVPGMDISSVPKGYFGEPIFEHGVFVELRGSHGSLGSGSNFLQLHVELERVFNFAPGWHLLLRNEFGATAASNFQKMPPVMRFFAGGEGSVRGFEYNSLSPVQTFYAAGRFNVGGTTYGCAGQGCPLQPVQAGGKDVITGTVEIDRDLPRKFGLAVFFDYGNAFNSFHTYRLLQYGAGLGFRVRLPVLTLGIDVGQPLSLPGHQLPRLYINFSPKL